MRIRTVSNTHHRSGNTWQTTFTSGAWETQNARSTKKTLRTRGARRSLNKMKKTECYCKNIADDRLAWGWWEWAILSLETVQLAGQILGCLFFSDDNEFPSWNVYFCTWSLLETSGTTLKNNVVEMNEFSLSRWWSRVFIESMPASKSWPCPLMEPGLTKAHFRVGITLDKELVAFWDQLRDGRMTTALGFCSNPSISKVPSRTSRAVLVKQWVFSFIIIPNECLLSIRQRDDPQYPLDKFPG